MPSLSNEESSLLLDVWKKIEDDLCGHGYKFMSTFIQENPKLYKKFYPDLKEDDEKGVMMQGTKHLISFGTFIKYNQSAFNAEIQKVKNVHKEIGVDTPLVEMTAHLEKYFTNFVGPSGDSSSTEAIKKFCNDVNAAFV